MDEISEHQNKIINISDDILLSKIIEKLNNNFESEEKKLFCRSFYLYTKYNNNDFIINTENICNWLGFSYIKNLIRLIKSKFKENIDYIIKFNQTINSRSDKQTIFISINCFKKLCLKAGTERSDQIHDYYLNLENIIMEIVKNEFNQNILLKEKEFNEILLLKDSEINNLLEFKNKEITNIQKQKENNFLTNYSDKRVLYLIFIQNENLCKFGVTTDIKERFKCHKREISENISLEYCIESMYNTELEQLIKEHCKNPDHVLYGKRVEKYFNEKKQTELIQLSESFTIHDLYKEIQKICHKDEIILRLMAKNTELEYQISQLKDQLINLTNKNAELANKNTELIEKHTIEKENLIQSKKNIEHIKFNENFISEDWCQYQIYDKSLKLVKSYKNIQELIDDKSIVNNVNKQNIYKACRKNCLYRNYRFYRLDPKKELCEYTIPQTIEINTSPTFEPVVQMNMDKTKIIDIYSNPLSTAEKLKKEFPEKELETIKKSITNNLSEKSNNSAYGYKFFYLPEVDKNLVNAYVKQGGIIPKVVYNKGQIKINKIDKNGLIIHTYNSFKETKETENVSEKALRKILDKKELLNGYYFERVVKKE